MSSGTGERGDVSLEVRTNATPGTTDANRDTPDLSKPPPALRLHRLGRRPVFLFAAAGLVLFALAGPKVPRDQRLRVPLGAMRPTVREAHFSWSSPSGEALREATFSFPIGGAPEALIHELRLPDGDYDVEVEIVLLEGRTVSRKRVTVSGATTTLDVSSRP